MSYRWALAGLGTLAVLGLGSPVMAATTTPTYAVNVSGSWSGSLSDQISPTAAAAGGWASGNAPTLDVPWGKPFTPTGEFSISAPVLPPGESYDGNTWSVSAQAWLTAGPYGANFCSATLTPHIQPGATWSVPLSQLWGTMGTNWDEPFGSPYYNCQIHVGAPIVLNSSGGFASQQMNEIIYGLPVNVEPPGVTPPLKPQFLRVTGSSKVYVNHNGTYEWVPSAALFTAMGGSFPVPSVSTLPRTPQR